MAEFFGFLFFGIIMIVVKFVNKNHNKTIIKEKNLLIIKLKKLDENGLISKKNRTNK